MSDKNFVDYVKICCRSGAGGAGSVHFFRDNKNSKGGPDGGDGGRGGHIILRGNKQLWTLLPLKYRKHVIAKDGDNGLGGLKTGASGKDIILEVPLGTIAKDAQSMEFVCEISEHGQETILVPGGRGGLGNNHFKSPTRRTPRYAQPGEDGKDEWKILELKILADVGLVGLPNAGKSTLLSAITAAKPKIANYAFTTLTPNLGIVSYRDSRSFIMADIPGIIEKAHEGKGLGIRFLKHIERNSLLLFIISGDDENINDTYKVLLNELLMYNQELLDKPRLVAISKSDLLDGDLQQMIEDELDLDAPHLFFSSVTNQNLQVLKDEIWKKLND